MDIKCWGSRGSISVSGRQYEKYGGETTCIEIIAKSGETIIIDAGTGMRALGNSFIERDITEYYLLFTHVHWDHIMGFAFFRPLQFSHVGITIQDRKFSGMTTRKVLNSLMQVPFFPIGLKDLLADIKFDKALNGTFNIGSVKVETIPTSHTGGGLGYKFTEDNKSFVFLTDNELGFDHPESRGFDAYLNFSRDADLLFHDGEYTQREYKRKISWGHSSIPDVLNLAIKANVKKLGLFHLNQDRTDAQMDKIIKSCQLDLKKKQSSLDCFGVSCDFEIHL
ncbi:MAG: MBL fold metallo-hydrolase [Proteobacteria bacterium]|nr:MBL fold metallo-hydrolase [Pseudomonadota bacterium]MBU1389321.1 MBL fold metallo-hydrolase [Pseudomonadota bacterium]MBU1544141.1 MBL fold metallo-hydrolase [Pseudomonadota bacterium]MBU2431324.1 MBL fold metallo-hydrolase [Pseudomonadota bacterium]MBU2482722.1 MBL fold metallo-hydrolase [Pseudomonadota bacterium]